MASKIATNEKIGRLGQRRQVVIPREIIENLRMRTGDFLAISQKNNTIVVKPKRVVDRDDTLTPEEARRLRQSLKQMRQGKTKPWAQIKHELGL